MAVALNWMRRLVNLQTNDVGIKKGRNHFLKKLLEVMKRSVMLRFLEHPKSKQLSFKEKQKIKEEITKMDETFKTPLLDELLLEGKESSTYTSMWSNDRRTYVAAKPIPGRGALIYMAVAEKPELGWTIPNEQ
ncbi:uncharacterized protein isoform X2 [Rhodnius prolixus]|uniref:uncharacterized protein isoform X2 n=1 Tax=Rhodnius prolixus TaxID=13249 RepID=UPI003D18D1B9